MNFKDIIIGLSRPASAFALRVLTPIADSIHRLIYTVLGDIKIDITRVDQLSLVNRETLGWMVVAYLIDED